MLEIQRRGPDTEEKNDALTSFTMLDYAMPVAGNATMNAVSALGHGGNVKFVNLHGTTQTTI